MASLAYTTVTNNGLVIPSSHLLDIDDEEKNLARKYSRKRYLLENMVFIFTREPDMLHQYYKIRANEYNTVLGLNHYPDAESKYDRNGYIMVARIGNFCVGGARINVRTPRRPDLLPMETNNFRLENCFPNLRHRQMRYCQVSGFSLLPEFRGGSVTREMIGRILSKAEAISMDMLFATCPLLNSRLYKQECALMGWKDPQVHHNIELPDDPNAEGMKLYLFSVQLERHLATDYVNSPVRVQPLSLAEI